MFARASYMFESYKFIKKIFATSRKNFTRELLSEPFPPQREGGRGGWARVATGLGAGNWLTLEPPTWGRKIDIFKFKLGIKK